MGSPERRTRNARGEGRLLRADIVAAARDILMEEGHEAAITLRGVARRVGIAAPSVYLHFESAAEIVQAVVVEAFAQLNSAIDDSVGSLSDPVERFLTGCRAYISFGLANPNVYKLLFDRNRELGGATPSGRDLDEDDLRRGPFSQLVVAVEDCIRTGASTATSGPSTALDVWVGMHGLVMLRGERYQVPWPPRDVMEPPLLRALGRIGS